MFEVGQGGPEQYGSKGLQRLADRYESILKMQKAAEDPGFYYSAYPDPELAAAWTEAQQAEADAVNQIAALQAKTQASLGQVQGWLTSQTYGIPNTAWLVGSVLIAYWLFRSRG